MENDHCEYDYDLQAYDKLRQRKLEGFTLNASTSLAKSCQPSISGTPLANRAEAMLAVDNIKISPATRGLISKCEEGSMTFAQARNAILANAGIMKKSSIESWKTRETRIPSIDPTEPESSTSERY